MSLSIFRPLSVLALASIAAVGAARAQTADPAVPRLPETVVTATRLGDGIPGTSTTIITADEIARSSGTTLQDLLGRQAGIQTNNLFGGVAGAHQTIDMRGFGSAATANTLVLINGRRLNDVDLGGVDFSAIPRDSIERIEITRGNSGAVLYGDGAMGGVINIVTKTGAGLPPAYRGDIALGSFNYREGSASTRQSFGPYSMSAYGNVIASDGYRRNNRLQQRNLATEARYAGEHGEYFVNLSADEQELGLPGGRLSVRDGGPLVDDPRGATTPFDYGYKRGLNGTLGGSRVVADGVELVVDGGFRRKDVHTASFVSGSNTYVDSVLTTLSLTPRANVTHGALGLPAKAIVGVDIYYSDYESDRGLHKNDPPEHRYELNQWSAAVYLQETVAVRRDTDISAGLRLQGIDVSARDRFDPNAPSAQFTPQGKDLDRRNTYYSAHLGAEHRLTNTLTLFGRMGRSIRVPTVDERVGLAAFGVPATFDTQVQTSHDVEAGFRTRWGALDWQTSAYVMNLRSEIHFNPVTFTNVNLDPTRREGVENSFRYAVTDRLRLRGMLSYTRAQFREGRFKNNDVPLVSDWTSTAGVGWDIVPGAIVLDFDARYFSEKRMDNDERNFQPSIPGHAIFDLRMGGDLERFRWSLTVQNLFDDRNYYENAVASTSVQNRYSAFPLPGRTALLKLGVIF